MHVGPTALSLMMPPSTLKRREREMVKGKRCGYKEFLIHLKDILLVFCRYTLYYTQKCSLVSADICK